MHDNENGRAASQCSIKGRAQCFESKVGCHSHCVAAKPAVLSQHAVSISLHGIDNIAALAVDEAERTPFTDTTYRPGHLGNSGWAVPLEEGGLKLNDRNTIGGCLEYNLAEAPETFSIIRNPPGSE
jgi:hypothetical protein